MRLILMLALVGCTSAAAPMPDAAPELFGEPCTPSGQAPVSTCSAADGEVGWCIENACRRNCIDGACPKGGTPTPVYGDCYCM